MKIGFRVLAVAVLASTAGLVMVHIASAKQAAAPTGNLPAPADPNAAPVAVPGVGPGGRSAGASTSSSTSSWSTHADPLADNPEAAKLDEAETQAAREAESLASQLRADTPALLGQQALSEALRAELKGKLRDALVRQFDAQQKRRSLEITSIEERLGKFKDTLKKRDAAKDTIINKRLDQLTGVGDDLGWEETGTRHYGLGSTAGSQYPYAMPRTKAASSSPPAPSAPAASPPQRQ
jgi:hypothetical protein